MFGEKVVQRILNTGRRPCPRCGRLMPEYLEVCSSCEWQEAEAREADRRDLRDTQDSAMASMRGR